MSSYTTFPANNCTIQDTVQVIKAVISSAAYAELGGLYINAKFAAPVWQTLKEMGHPRPPAPIQTDELTAFGVIANKIIPKFIKAMDV